MVLFVWRYPNFQQIQVGGNIFFTGTDIPATPFYAEVTWTFVGTGSDAVIITEQNNPSYQLVDNVSVTLLSARIAEPSTWAMMLLGFAGLGFAATRRARVPSAI